MADLFYGIWVGMVFLWGMLSLPWDAMLHVKHTWPKED